MRASALSVPFSATASALPTPATSAFDYSSFPASPAKLPVTKSILDPVKKQDNAYLSLPIAQRKGRRSSANTERTPPASPAPQTPSSASHYSPRSANEQFAERYSRQMAKKADEASMPRTPASKLSPLILSDYKFPYKANAPGHPEFVQAVAAPEWPFCSLPTPPLSVVDGSVDLRSNSSASSATSSSRLRAFTDRFLSASGAVSALQTSASAPQRSSSNPPPESSDLPWLESSSPAKSDASMRTAARVPIQSMSTPELAPYANAFRHGGDGVETLRFVPRKFGASFCTRAASDDTCSSLAARRSYRTGSLLELSQCLSRVSSLIREQDPGQEASWPDVQQCVGFEWRFLRSSLAICPGKAGDRQLAV